MRPVNSFPWQVKVMFGLRPCALDAPEHNTLRTLNPGCSGKELQGFHERKGREEQKNLEHIIRRQEALPSNLHTQSLSRAAAINPFLTVLCPK